MSCFLPRPVAGYLLKAFSRGTAPQDEVERLHRDLAAAIGARDDENRDAGERRTRYIQLIGGFRDYVESAWFEQAVAEMREGRDVDFDYSRPPQPPVWIWKTEYNKSHWCNFERTLKEHQGFAMELLNPVFGEMEMVI